MLLPTPSRYSIFSMASFFLPQVDKYVFPPSGATGYLVTPSHKLGQTFKFKDYAPKVFKKIREHFGVDKVLLPLCLRGEKRCLFNPCSMYVWGGVHT